MKIIRVVTIFILCICFQTANAQFSWQHYYELLIENSDDADEESMQTLYDILSETADNPLNINTITEEQLQSLQCFSDIQIEAITHYVERYAPLRTKGELLMIPYLDDARRGLLSALTFIGDVHEKERTFIDTLRYNQAVSDYRYMRYQNSKRGEVTTSTHIPFYSRKGDGDAYAGSPIKHWFRTSYKVNNNIRLGVVASQDAGEPFFAGKGNYGYDYYSGYVRLQRLGIVKNLVVGRYRLRSGMGLILNNNLMFGKTFSIQPLTGSMSTSLLPHSSRSESNFMQGAAATLGLSKHVEATLFASYRKIDATVTEDGMGIRTIVTTGYHRTESELERRHNASQSSAGTNFRYSAGNLSIGLTGIYNHYSLPLRPIEPPIALSQIYRVHAPEGQDFWNASIDYAYHNGKLWRFTGETGTDNHGNIATVNMLSLRFSPRFTMMGIQRFYPYKFCSTMGRSFSEGGSNQDESGVYIGAQWQPNSRLSFSAYSDVAYFAWPRYQAMNSSHSFDNLIQAEYKPSAHSSLNLRYRVKMRQKDADSSLPGYNNGDLIYRNDHHLRLFYATRNGAWTMKTQADFSYCKYKEESLGGMLSQTVIYTMKPWKVASGINYFHTRDYNSRVFAYEQSTPYNLSFPSFFGHGCRAYALAEATILSRLSVIGKIGYTHYFDRNEIGSGQQLISSNHQTDVDIMLRWIF